MSHFDKHYGTNLEIYRGHNPAKYVHRPGVGLVDNNGGMNKKEIGK